MAGPGPARLTPKGKGLSPFGAGVAKRLPCPTGLASSGSRPFSGSVSVGLRNTLTLQQKGSRLNSRKNFSAVMTIPR